MQYLLNDVDERFNLFGEEASFWGAKIQFDCLLNHLCGDHWARLVNGFGIRKICA